MIFWHDLMTYSFLCLETCIIVFLLQNSLILYIFWVINHNWSNEEIFDLQGNLKCALAEIMHFFGDVTFTLKF